MAKTSVSAPGAAECEGSRLRASTFAGVASLRRLLIL